MSVGLGASRERGGSTAEAWAECSVDCVMSCQSSKRLVVVGCIMDRNDVQLGSAAKMFVVFKPFFRTAVQSRRGSAHCRGLSKQSIVKVKKKTSRFKKPASACAELGAARLAAKMSERRVTKSRRKCWSAGR